MKNLSLILNVVLLVAVAVLFYMQFSGGKTSSVMGSVSTEGLKVAYINSDTLLKYFDYVKATNEKLQAKGKKLQQDYESRAGSLQGEIESYRRNRANMTIGQAEAVEVDLSKKGQNLQLYQENLSQQLMADQQTMTRELYEKVTSFLKQYGEEKGLQVVFKYDVSSDLLFGGAGLDISKDVINGLNEAYKMEKSIPAKADSAAKK